jgi:hypothetical protein
MTGLGSEQAITGSIGYEGEPTMRREVHGDDEELIAKMKSRARHYLLVLLPHFLWFTHGCAHIR